MWTFYKFTLYNVSSFLSTMGVYLLHTGLHLRCEYYLYLLIGHLMSIFFNLKGQWTLFIFLMKFFINWIVSHNEVFRLDKVKELTNLLKNSCFSKKNFSYMFDKNNIHLHTWSKIKMLFHEKLFSLLSSIRL